DYTRTFTTGFVEGPIKEAYALVLAAQQAGFDALRVGVRGSDADAAARRVVDGTAFAGMFGHGLGHGLGPEVHEAPRLSTETKDMQYLYDSGDEVVFMDQDTYEQTSLPRATVKDALEFMLPSSSVQMLLVNGAPTGVQLPASVELAVSETEPGVKGDTVSNV